MGFVRRLMGRSEAKSRDVAKQRLQLVLVHDRANISPGLLEMIKDEIISVISRHIEIDHDGVEVHFAQHGSENRLVADIPLSNPGAGRRGDARRN